MTKSKPVASGAFRIANHPHKSFAGPLLAVELMIRRVFAV
jgi:hypothetical protein